MALLERVATLVRANINDLVDRAEDPEKMIKQVILDMQNQFIQVKTQVAIAIADLHLLEKKKQENIEKQAEWMRKAELAVEKKKDDLARPALERALSYQQMSASFDEQIADQKTEVELLKDALRKLDQKISEAQAKSDLLIAQHRRSRAVTRAGQAQMKAGDKMKLGTFDRMVAKVNREQAVGRATTEMLGDDVEERLAALQREDEVERLLNEIKSRKALPA
jgi:phage shock protein A